MSRNRLDDADGGRITTTLRYSGVADALRNMRHGYAALGAIEADLLYAIGGLRLPLRVLLDHLSLRDFFCTGTSMLDCIEVRRIVFQ